MLLHLLRRLGFALSFCVLLAVSPGLRAEEIEGERPESIDSGPGEAPDSAAGTDEAPIDAAVAYSLEALAPTLSTPEAAFAFVRDQTAYEPYAGVMKGAAGTLLTRGGNHWDRALLLQKLLAAQGVEAQLVFGTMAEAEAGRRLKAATLRPAATSRLLESLSMTGNDDEAPEPERLAELHGRMDARRADLQRLETVPREWIAPALVDLQPPVVVAPCELVWVRAAIEGRLVDFDPSLPDAKQGAAPRIEGEVNECDQPPEETSHRMTLVVALEEFGPEGGLQRRDLLEKEFTAERLLESGLRLAVLPRTSGKAAGDFRALVIAGEEQAESESFRLSGAAVGGSAEEAGEAAGFGGFFGGDEEPAPTETSTTSAKSNSRLARLFVEFSFTSPGQAPERFRRMILDRAEPAGEGWRLVPALAEDRFVRPLLIQIWDLALDAGALHPVAVWEAQWAALEAADPLLTMAQAGAPGQPEDVGPPGASPSLQAFFLASGLRRAAVCTEVGSSMRSFMVRPRLAMLRRGAEIADWTRPAALPPRYREGIDIVNTPLRFFGGDRAAEVALRAGIADTALEVHALGQPAELNTLPVFAAALKQRLPVLAVVDQETLARMLVPAPVRTALRDELLLSRRLAAVAQPVAYQGGHTFAWWSVDPESGYALGRLELGGGQGMVEVSKTHQQVSEWTEIFAKFYGSLLKCYMKEFGKAMAGVEVDYANLSVGVQLKHGAPGQSPLPSPEELTECVAKAACTAIADLMTSQINVAIANAEARKLREMVAKWLAGKALKKANKNMCKDIVGGGK